MAFSRSLLRSGERTCISSIQEQEKFNGRRQLRNAKNLALRKGARLSDNVLYHI